MKILFINQHTSNHGDEAAAKSLIRGLRDYGINDEVFILYSGDELLESEKYKIDQNIKHSKCYAATIIDKIMIILTFIMPFSLVSLFYCFGNFTKYTYNIIKEFDLIINSPGGVNIGPYKDWRYLWRLYVALKLNKKVGVYSISFGPIPDNFLFKKISLYVLNNVEFLSLRDKKSQQFATDLNIKYTPSIDTAFLNNQLESQYPKEISDFIAGRDYVIVVPNQLYNWHPTYKDTNHQLLDNIYISIINYFLSNNIPVVLLPQMFGSQNDSIYFDMLRKQCNNAENVFLVNDKYSSDVQQEIIKKAYFLVGARYHTIIFSINNNRPFLSLSYEHKMINTLELLNLVECNVEISALLDNTIFIDDILKLNCEYMDASRNKIYEANLKANQISRNTLDFFVNNFIKHAKHRPDLPPINGPLKASTIRPR